MRTRTAALALALGTLALGAARAARPWRIQGRLEAPGGAPHTTPVDVTLALYDQATGGTPLATETDPVLPETGGVFWTDFGDTADLGGVDLGAPLWIGVTVDPAGGGTEAAPRVALSADLWAQRAEVTEALDLGSDVDLGGNRVVDLPASPTSFSAVPKSWLDARVGDPATLTTTATTSVAAALAEVADDVGVLERKLGYLLSRVDAPAVATYVVNLPDVQDAFSEDAVVIDLETGAWETLQSLNCTQDCFLPGEDLLIESTIPNSGPVEYRMEIFATTNALFGGDETAPPELRECGAGGGQVLEGYRSFGTGPFLPPSTAEVEAETGGDTIRRVVAVASDGGGNFLVEVTGVATPPAVTLTLRVLDLGALTRTPYFTATEDC